MESTTSERLVKIWIGDEPVTFIVESETPTFMVVRNAAIPKDVYNLVNIGGKWVQEGTTTPVDIYEGVTLTGFDNVDTNILSHLDDDTLEAVCAVDIRVKAICDGRELWLLKLTNLDRRFVIPSSYHKDLRKLYHRAKAISNTPNYPLYIAARQGLLGIVKTFPPIDYTQTTINAAASRGNLDIVEWVNKSTNPPLVPSQTTFDLAVSRQYNDVVQWSEARGYQQGVTTADMAAKHCSATVISRLGDQGIYPTRKGILAAQLHGCLDVLKWLFSKGRLAI